MIFLQRFPSRSKKIEYLEKRKFYTLFILQYIHNDRLPKEKSY